MWMLGRVVGELICMSLYWLLYNTPVSLLALDPQTLNIVFGSGEEAAFDAERQNKASRHCFTPISHILVEAIRHVRWFSVAFVISRKHQIYFK